MSNSGASIALNTPKYPHNVGAVLRAASCYGARSVAFDGNRVVERVLEAGRMPREERLRGYKNVGLYHTEDPHLFLKKQMMEEYPGKIVVPVAVEMRPNSECLFDFEHPENAVYVFGPEDGSIDPRVLSKCQRFVVIPTLHCTNLAAAVYTILFHRALQQYQQTGIKPTDLELEPVSDDENVALFVKAMEKKLMERR